MDRVWNTVPAAATRKCNCHFCKAGCFHGNRGLASVHQRQAVPYMQTKTMEVVHTKTNGGYPAGPAPCTEPDWAQRQAGRIRAWHQAEKIRAWRQALNKEDGQAGSGDQTEGKTGDGPGLAPSEFQQENEAGEDAELAPSEDQHKAVTAEQALNGDRGDAEPWPPACLVTDNAGDEHLSSNNEPTKSKSGHAMGEQSKLSTGSKQRYPELMSPKEKKTRIKRKVSVPTDKTWALEQAARIKAWREAKNREVTQAPDSLSVDALTEDVENQPLTEAP